MFENINSQTFFLMSIMILSNYTFSLSEDASKNFEAWIKVEISQSFKEVSNLLEVKTFKLLTELETDSVNYAIQFYFEEEWHLVEFDKNELSNLLKNVDLLFSGSYAYFHTVLKEF